MRKRGAETFCHFLAFQKVEVDVNSAFNNLSICIVIMSSFLWSLLRRIYPAEVEVLADVTASFELKPCPFVRMILRFDKERDIMSSFAAIAFCPEWSVRPFRTKTH